MATTKTQIYMCMSSLAVALLTVWGQGDACCAPKAFSGPVRILRTTVAPGGMPDTSVKIMMNAYDAVNKRVGITASESDTTRNIFDFGKGLQYVVTGNWYAPDNTSKCTKYPLHIPWREACVPDNATRGEEFYMGHKTQEYYRQTDAVTFTYTQGKVKAKVMVTSDRCFPVGEVVYDTSDPATGVNVINRMYVNQSQYNNEEFFKISPNLTCVPDPNPPPMSPWEWTGLLGWLIGLPRD